MQVEVTIGRLGAQGDGAAVTENGPVFIPFALPGERVRIKVGGERGALLEVLEPSPERVTPECPHFGKCGGCAVQHLESGAYLAWKSELVAAALRSRGIEAGVEETRPVSARSRRRTAFTLTREGKAVKICYHGRKSHELVEIEQCLLLEPRLEALVSRLPKALAPVVKAKGVVEVWLAGCENGIDMTLKGAADAGPQFWADLAGEAPSLGVIRVTANGDLAFSLATPVVRFAGAAVTPPPGAFLQAVAAAEEELASLVVAGVGDARDVADLFAGMGAFTFPLARRSRVTAVESDRQALAALAAASRTAAGFKPITTLARDLFRDPLSAKELKAFDAVALDPPRAGASAQVAELAKSTVSRVVMASCNPAAFARDARTLIDGGYELRRVAPVDQFLYSPHLELAAQFVRP